MATTTYTPRLEKKYSDEVGLQDRRSRCHIVCGRVFSRRPNLKPSLVTGRERSLGAITSLRMKIYARL